MQNGSLQKYFRSEITAMSPYKPGEQPQTGKSIKLNTNENPTHPPRRFWKRSLLQVPGWSDILIPSGQPFGLRRATFWALIPT
jgi:hypothetical protein